MFKGLYRSFSPFENLKLSLLLVLNQFDSGRRSFNLKQIQEVLICDDIMR